MRGVLLMMRGKEREVIVVNFIIEVIALQSAPHAACMLHDFFVIFISKQFTVSRAISFQYSAERIFLKKLVFLLYFFKLMI